MILNLVSQESPLFMHMCSMATNRRKQLLQLFEVFCADRHTSIRERLDSV